MRTQSGSWPPDQADALRRIMHYEALAMLGRALRHRPSMPSMGDGEPTLGAGARACFAYDLAGQFLGMQVEKKLFGRKFIRLSRLVFTGAFLFQTGALLGHAFRNSAELFATAYSPDGKDDPARAVTSMRRLGREIAEAAPHAATMLDLFMADAMAMSRKPSDIHWSMLLPFLSEYRAPVDEALAIGMIDAVSGAGFGMEFPEHTERLVTASYEISDKESWREAFKHGVVGSAEPPEQRTFEEYEDDARASFAEFCAEHYPELLKPLALEGALE